MPPEPSRWEFLLSHHSVDRYSRTLAVRVRRRALHLCARCLGQGLGAGAWVGLLYLGPIVRWDIFGLAAQGAFALLPLPAAVDWAAQAVGRHESSNALRVLTGFLLGLALADLAGLLLTGHWLWFAGGLVVWGAYALSLATLLRISGAWRAVLEQHFPGLDLGLGP